MAYDAAPVTVGDADRIVLAADAPFDDIQIMRVGGGDALARRGARILQALSSHANSYASPSDGRSGPGIEISVFLTKKPFFAHCMPRNGLSTVGGDQKPRQCGTPLAGQSGRARRMRDAFLVGITAGLHSEPTVFDVLLFRFVAEHAGFV